MTGVKRTLRRITETVLVVGACSALELPSARAEDADRELTFEAETVRTEPPYEAVTLEGDVRIGVDRYRVRADRVEVSAPEPDLSDERAVRATGNVQIAWCAVDDPPIALAGSEARVDEEGRVAVDDAVLEAGGFPVFYAPRLWLTPPSQAGLLPPWLGFRGEEGVLVGGGAYVPWGGEHAAELRVGGLSRGGGVVEGSYQGFGRGSVLLEHSTLGDRAGVIWRGSLPTYQLPPNAFVAWDVDWLRGDRARAGTPDLRSAAARFDRAAFAIAWDFAPHGGPVVGVGVRQVAVRGDGEIAMGPSGTVGWSSSFGHVEVDATASGVAFVRSAEAANRTVPLGDARAGLAFRPPFSPLRVAAGLRTRASQGASDEPGDQVAGPEPARDASRVGATAYALMGLPFIRDDSGYDHWVVPEVLAAAGLVQAVGQTVGDPDSVAVVGGGLSTRLSRHTAELFGGTVRAGLLVGPPASSDSAPSSAVGQADAQKSSDVAAGASIKLSADAGYISGTLRAAAARTPVGATEGWLATALWTSPGQGRPRVGSSVLLSTRGVLYATRATQLTDDERALGWAHRLVPPSIATWQPTLDVPWTRSFRTTSEIWFDLAGPVEQPYLGTAHRAGFTHPCGCFGLTARVAHRPTREGIDVGVLFDLVPDRLPPRLTE